MKQLYGTSFLTIYGETPAPLWVGKIADLTDEQCRKGLSRLADQGREYPANLTEFVEACKPKPKGVRYYGVPITEAQKRALLAPPTATREHIDGCVSRMKAKLRAVQVPKPEREKIPPAKGCTCKATGECDVCVGYMIGAVPRETGA